MTINLIVKQYLQDQGVSLAWVAEKLGESNQNFGQKLNGKHMDVAFLMRISLALKQDLFQLLSEEFRLQLAKGQQTIQDKYKITYQNLLEENVQLHRELRDKTAPKSAPSAGSAPM